MLAPAWLWKELAGTLGHDLLHVGYMHPCVHSWVVEGCPQCACHFPAAVNINEVVGGRPGLSPREEWK